MFNPPTNGTTTLNIDPWSLLNALRDGLAVLDSAGTICYHNTAWQQLNGNPMNARGFQAGDNYIEHFTATFAPREPDAEGIATGLRELLSGQRASFDYEISSANGERQHRLAIHVVPVTVRGAHGALLQQRVVTDREHVAEPCTADSEVGDIAEALQRRDAILEAVSFAAEQFLKPGSWEDNIQTVLERLGNATNVSRIYMFETHTAGEGTLLMSQRYEWAAPGIDPQIGNPELQHLAYVDAGFGRWAVLLSRGEVIYGHVKDFPNSEREMLEPQDISSIVVVPIFAGPVWWGFIGFDQCYIERTWTQPEIDTLRAAANIIGLAIQRSKAEETLRLSAVQEEIIRLQEATLAELSTPLLFIGQGVVLMPLIGAMDSRRAQQVMDELLFGIERHNARVAILDITGVPVVDTQVAEALIRTARAARLLGAQVVITGIGPEVAQTLVGLGVVLSDSGILTHGSLQRGVAYALKHRE